MELTGKFIKVVSEKSGTSQSTGNSWTKKEMLFDISSGSYSKQVVVGFLNDNSKHTFVEGQQVSMSVDVTSREFNEKYYTDVTCWKVLGTPITDGAVQSQQNQQKPVANTGSVPKPDDNMIAPEPDDLPF